MGQDSPFVRDTSRKFPNRRVGEPELVIAPAEDRLFVFRFNTQGPDPTP
jgi:hypothetical protein